MRGEHTHTNSHNDFGKDVYHTATNTKAFTGILIEKEQFYSMPYYS